MVATFLTYWWRVFLAAIRLVTFAKKAIFLGIARHVTGRCHTRYFLPRSFGYFVRLWQTQDSEDTRHAGSTENLESTIFSAGQTSLLEPKYSSLLKKKKTFYVASALALALLPSFRAWRAWYFVSLCAWAVNFCYLQTHAHKICHFVLHWYEIQDICACAISKSGNRQLSRAVQQFVSKEKYILLSLRLSVSFSFKYIISLYVLLYAAQGNSGVVKWREVKG